MSNKKKEKIPSLTEEQYNAYLDHLVKIDPNTLIGESD